MPLSSLTRLPTSVPTPPGADTPIPDWSLLKFNPLGIYNLRRHLGVVSDQPGLFKRYQDRFLASDIAWFAAGLVFEGWVHSTAKKTATQPNRNQLL